MQMEGISHLTFFVRDLDHMTTFVCDGLGATEVYDSSAKNYSLSHEKFFMLGDTRIAAMQGESPAQHTYRHVAFKVADDALSAFEAQLRSIGADVTEPRPHVEEEGILCTFMISTTICSSFIPAHWMSD